MIGVRSQMPSSVKVFGFSAAEPFYRTGRCAAYREVGYHEPRALHRSLL
jgi:hypothetical protein